ncbi:hypothetical protein GS597_11840 [Synechococcales cyanobacterium C]|uniref:Uncharacterized protein n=1 Tax=Petrachloros mirabilis ULC683 TaxID=2781853 RepID=A0A8K1ZZY2_9CYAN|nr:hypothetical protein [Petrachloros mirabilis]NCJ07183.1 hypothetical protein [Petrachloros mirabilis ULC683]
MGVMMRMSATSSFGLMIALGLAIAPASLAQSVDSGAPLNAPTLPQVVDQKAELDKFWPESSFTGDASFMFGIQYDDIKIRNATKRLSVFSRDVLRQQGEDQPIIRTRDLVSPFSTSVYELEDSALGSGF